MKIWKMKQEEEEIIERMKNCLIRRYNTYNTPQGKALGAKPKEELKEELKNSIEFLRNYCKQRKDNGNLKDDFTIDYCRRMIVALKRALNEINMAEKEEPEK